MSESAIVDGLASYLEAQAALAAMKRERVCIMYHKFERPQKPAIFYVKLKMSVQRT